MPDMDFASSPLLGVVKSNSRLDYENTSSLSLSVVLEPEPLNCSLVIIIQLLNIPDNPISFDRRSLAYTVNRSLSISSYLGRVRLLDIDQLFSSDYRFYLSNQSTIISVDSTTGSILLKEPIDRKPYGSNFSYEIIATNANQQQTLTDLLVINIHRSSFGQLTFGKDHYRMNISRSMRPGSLVFQVTARFDDPTADITYSMISGVEEFSIEKSTGGIRLNGYIPSSMTQSTLMIEAKEEEMNLTARTMVVLTVLEDQDACFNVLSIRQCSVDWNTTIGASVCTVGSNAKDCLYQIMDPMNSFALMGKSGTIINRKLFHDQIVEQHYNITLLAWDRRNQVSCLIKEDRYE